MSDISAGLSDATLDEMLAGLEGVTQGPRHMYVSPNLILLTDEAGRAALSQGAKQ